MLEVHQLSANLDRVMLSFFRDITGEDDPEAARECFLTTSQSDQAEVGLARLSEELIGRVRLLCTEELSAAIRRVQEMQRKEFVLVVGTES